MNDEIFLETIRQNPEDDAPRLVYADWLEEQGDMRGEFLRLMLQLEGCIGEKEPAIQLSSPLYLREKQRARAATHRDNIKLIKEKVERLREKIDPNWLAWVDRGRRFSVYWSNEVCQIFAARGELGKPLRFIVGGYNFLNLFASRRIAAGDYVYPITVRKRRLMVIARMCVREVTTPQVFLTAQPHESPLIVDYATEVLVGEGGTPVRLDRQMPLGAFVKSRTSSGRKIYGQTYVYNGGGIRSSVDCQGIFQLSMRTALDFERTLAGLPIPDLPPEEPNLFS
jgi:uncharacterized protein (TIGR02996 family)